MRLRDILYIEDDMVFARIYLKENVLIKKYSQTVFLSNLLKKVFFDYKEYKKKMGLLLNIKSKIPIYVNNMVFLIPYRVNAKKYWINYANCDGIYFANNLVHFNFIDGSYLELNIERRVFNRSIEKIEIVEEFFNETNGK